MCIGWSLHLKGSNHVQTIRRMFHQLVYPRWEYLEKGRSEDGCQRLNTSSIVLYLPQLCTCYATKNFQISWCYQVEGYPQLEYWQGNFTWGKQNYTARCYLSWGRTVSCGYCISGFQVDNTWFLISDARILRQKNYSAAQRRSLFFMYWFIKKVISFVAAPPNSSNVTAEVNTTSKLT